MPIRLFAFALTSVLFVAYACGVTQRPNDDPTLGQAQEVQKSVDGRFAQPTASDTSVLRSILAGNALFTVTQVDADGTVMLGPSEVVAPQFREQLGSGYAEGLYVLVINNEKPAVERRVLRVEVTDVAAGLRITLKTGPQAAARVRMNDSAMLVRPSPATTAGMRALPDYIPLMPDPAEPSFENPREGEARRQSTNHLKQIMLAMHNYESANGAFPPAVIFGPDGKPWHSWRVLILPFLDAGAELFRAYDFSQPWDSPKNQALVDKMPAIYRDPIFGTNEPNTSYAALVGPAAIFHPEGRRQQANPKQPPIGVLGMRIAGITDGTSNTVMISLVEPARKIPWTKPEDIDVGPGFKGFGQPGGIAAPYTFHGQGGGKSALFAFADGSVHMIGTSIDRRTLEALVTRAGGEVIAFDAIPRESNSMTAQVRVLSIRVRAGKTTAVIEAETGRSFAPMPVPTKEFRPARKVQR